VVSIEVVEDSSRLLISEKYRKDNPKMGQMDGFVVKQSTGVS
jgi:hypothetical protein